MQPLQHDRHCHCDMIINAATTTMPQPPRHNTTTTTIIIKPCNHDYHTMQLPQYDTIQSLLQSLLPSLLYNIMTTITTNALVSCDWWCWHLGPLAMVYT